MATELSDPLAQTDSSDRLAVRGGGSAGQLVRYATDSELLQRVLRVYRPHCRYLKTAAVTGVPEEETTELPIVSGDFAIAESCYIDDTGHFNSVEFNICYNQMAYYLIAKMIKESLHPVFRDWTLDDFWQRQLGSILITDFKSTFRRQMRGRDFSGKASIVDVVHVAKTERWNPLIVLRTTSEFWEETGGYCRGEVKIAICQPV